MYSPHLRLKSQDSDQKHGSKNAVIATFRRFPVATTLMWFQPRVHSKLLTQTQGPPGAGTVVIWRSR